jgi:hypothetical protein
MDGVSCRRDWFGQLHWGVLGGFILRGVFLAPPPRVGSHWPASWAMRGSLLWREGTLSGFLSLSLVPLLAHDRPLLGGCGCLGEHFDDYLQG